MTEGSCSIYGRAFYSPRTKQKHIGDIPAMYSVVCFIRSPPLALFELIISHTVRFVNGSLDKHGYLWYNKCNRRRLPLVLAVVPLSILSRGMPFCVRGGYFFFIIMSMIPKITTTRRFKSASTSKVVMLSPPLRVLYVTRRNNLPSFDCRIIVPHPAVYCQSLPKNKKIQTFRIGLHILFPSSSIKFFGEGLSICSAKTQGKTFLQKGFPRFFI